MSFITPVKTREPRFYLGEEVGTENIREAIREAVRAGRIICKIAPPEYWVDICERKADEWANYGKFRGNIIWSLPRINDILAKAEIRNSFDRIWEVTSVDSLPWMIGAELGQEIIRMAAANEEIDIKGFWRHYSDSSSESEVTITWKHITRESRYGIGN